jgi:hypothetical protein
MTTPTVDAGQPADTKQDGGAPATFTQEEVDAMIASRAKRVAQQQYGDYNDLKAKAEQFDKQQEANASDLEKATKAARDEGRAEATQQFNGILINAEARAMAAAARFRNPEVAVRAIDLAGVRVGTDGKVDQAAITSLLADLAKSDPYLVDDGQPAPPARPKVDSAQGQQRQPIPRGQQGIEEARKRFGTTQQ